jgi:hypothetical protein
MTGTSKFEDAFIALAGGTNENLSFFKSQRQRNPARSINLFFGLAFPLVLLLLFTLINSNLPAEAQSTMFSPNR